MTEPEKKVRDQIELYFRQTSRKQLSETEKVPFDKFLNPEDEGKRILLTIPESLGDVFVITSLFKSLMRQYPWARLYVATNPAYFEILKGNPYVTKVIPFVPEMDNLHWSEGIGGGQGSGHKGWFEIAFLCHVPTQRIQMYQHNGLTNLAFDLKYTELPISIEVEPPLPTDVAQILDKGVTEIIFDKPNL